MWYSIQVGYWIHSVDREVEGSSTEVNDWWYDSFLRVIWEHYFYLVMLPRSKHRTLLAFQKVCTLSWRGCLLSFLFTELWLANHGRTPGYQASIFTLEDSHGDHKLTSIAWLWEDTDVSSKELTDWLTNHEAVSTWLLIWGNLIVKSNVKDLTDFLICKSYAFIWYWDLKHELFFLKCDMFY